MAANGNDPGEDLYYHAHNFGALPPESSGADASKIVLLPVPYETTTTYRKGCWRGPAAIIEASANMELYDEELECEPCQVGVHTLPPLDVPDEAEKMIDRVDAIVAGCLEKNQLVTVLGGEHTVAIGPVRAASRAYDPLSVLFLDAHADFRQSYRGNKYSHACTARRISELCHIVQVGVRSLSAKEADALKGENITTFWASDLRGSQADGQWEDSVGRVVEELSQNVYISIDADVFDPSLMPAVGTPEPGGLLWDEILDILRAVIAARNIVGADLVELAPIDDFVHPQFVAARLLQKIWGYVFRTR